MWKATAGFLAGSGWVTLGVATVAVFERRSGRYILINGGYMTISFVTNHEGLDYRRVALRKNLP